MQKVIRCSKCRSNLLMPENKDAASLRCPNCGCSIAIQSRSETCAETDAGKGLASSTPPPVEQFSENLQSNAPPVKASHSRPTQLLAVADQDEDGLAAELAHAFFKRGIRGTQVNVLVASILGVSATIAVYLLFLPLHNTFAGALLYHRGLVPFAIMFLSGLSLAILLLKWGSIRCQRQSFRKELLPTTIGGSITPQNANEFLTHLTEVTENSAPSFLEARISRGLDHLRSGRSSQDITHRLQSQSEIDAHAVFSSYKLIKVCIWAIPILGFVGTVIGIGAAVGGFAATINSAGELDAIKDSLGSVTTGLALAFDTTLLALVMSMIVMFPTSHIQKQEEELLNRVDSYCNENFFKRLEDSSSDKSATVDIISSLRNLFEKQQAEWDRKCQQTTINFGRLFAKTLQESNQSVRQANQQLIGDVHSIIKCTTNDARDIAKTLHSIQRKQVDQFSHSLTLITETASQISSSLEQVGRECDRTNQDLSLLLNEQGRFTHAAESHLKSIAISSESLSMEIRAAAERISESDWLGVCDSLSESIEVTGKCTPALIEAIEQLNRHLERPERSSPNSPIPWLPRLFRRKIAVT